MSTLHNRYITYIRFLNYASFFLFAWLAKGRGLFLIMTSFLFVPLPQHIYLSAK